MASPAFFSGTGRRKTAIARVRLLPGEGEIVVNGRSLEEHFGNAVNETELRLPFRVTGTEGRYNAMIKVEGGGVTGQAGAIRHGIARALLEVDPEGNRLPLRQAGLPHARSAHEGTQEVRAQASPQGAAVHEAIDRGGRSGGPMRALPAALARSRTFGCARSRARRRLRLGPPERPRLGSTTGTAGRGAAGFDDDAGELPASTVRPRRARPSGDSGRPRGAATVSA